MSNRVEQAQRAIERAGREIRDWSHWWKALLVGTGAAVVMLAILGYQVLMIPQ